MSILHLNRSLLLPCKSEWKSATSVSASVHPGVRITIQSNNGGLCFEETKERIRKLFNKVELSVSSYDTAWIAMVPSPFSSQTPRFPGCLNWISDNQLSDGSWGLSHCNPLLLKDALLTTLACVVALKQWGVGQEQIEKGLRFIQLNIASATDKDQYSPIGFDIIFSGLLELAIDLDLNPLEPTDMSTSFQKRDLALRRCYESYSEEKKSYLAYVSEGMGKLQDWEMVMKYQRKNGSLFNSPATTAAALTHLQNASCLDYLHSVLNKHGNAVPTVYPVDIYMRLSMVDNLERLGISQHFREEVKTMLDEIYRCWQQGEEEIIMDAATCGLAFRLLRLNGYNVSADPLTKFTDEGFYINSYGGPLIGIDAVLELYRASLIVIYPDETDLEKQNSWSSGLLKQNLSQSSVHFDRLYSYSSQEVFDALKFPFYADLDRVATRRNIEQYNADSIKILKTSYRSSNINNKDFLKLAVEDFNICQSIHLKELKHLERWVAENRLDKLTFARQKLAYCYFSAAATFSSVELSDARISWAKNGVLTTVVDDFFDIGGSVEELANLIQLVEKWEVNLDTDCCSEQVQIIFSALYHTVCEIGGKAFSWQSRSVMNHIIQIWLDLLNAMLKEAEWVRDSSVPAMDEYMASGYVSFALGPIVLPALYFVGPKLSEQVVYDAEFHKLFKLMSTCGRLLNDIQGFERESKHGKLNAVSLQMVHSNGEVTEKEAISELKRFVDNQRKELLRLVLQGKGSVVPRDCKDVFWKMSKVFHLFYMDDDGFTSNEKIKTVKAVIHEPISLDELSGDI